MRCVVGDWVTTLDGIDQKAFEQAADGFHFTFNYEGETVSQPISRAELHRIICELYGRPWGLTALKAHANGACCCD